MQNRWLIVLVMVATLWLIGCGQKGPLYLPDDDEEAQLRRWTN